MHRARLGQEGRHGRGDELLALAPTDHQRALLAGADERVGLLDAHRHEGEVALELGERLAHGQREIAFVVGGHQVGDHLGVGLGGEHVAFADQALLQRHVVLDDPVDDDVQPVLGVVVGMGVLLADAPVRGPARVADPGGGDTLGHRHGAGVLAVVELCLQRAQIADRAHRLDPLARDQ